jgi:hypothetical protein
MKWGQAAYVSLFVGLFPFNNFQLINVVYMETILEVVPPAVNYLLFNYL